eukprot:CAMPEP_0176476832 /NCGR_PEP_ID=MMETSP0200_2-20121128/275_1 /TAXON_ID=947934 /ORGANISM="Chaetoceros sp., Strain GSL56" /LENGTH=512 /DNA_ID=CAMNT_0017872553 /DNA_START=3350 /DNA_END=4885 /DNA_ORIENTATION=+
MNDSNRPPSQSRDEIRGRSGNSPLVHLDSFFAESDGARDEFSQRYNIGNASSYAAHAHSQINAHPPPDYSHSRYEPPGQSSLYRYGYRDPAQALPSSILQDPQGHHPSSWSSQRTGSYQPSYPGADARNIAQPPQDIWYGRDNLGGMPSHSSTQPVRIREGNTQLPPISREGYPYSPQASYGNYPPPYYPPPRHYPDVRSPDPRYSQYPTSYPPYHAGYYPGDHPGYYPQRGGHVPPYGRPDFIPGMGVGHIPSQAPMGLTNISFIKDINDNDVLCGRGGATNSHCGNRSYRKLVKKFKDKYLKAKKKEKPSVAAEVVEIIRNLNPPGRFLKKDKETGWYLDIGDARAKEKTSQALREGAPLIRRQMFEGTYQETGSVSDSTPEKSTGSPRRSTEEDEVKDDPVNDPETVFSPIQQRQTSFQPEKNSTATNPDNSDTDADEKTGVQKNSNKANEEETKKRRSPVKEESPSKRIMKKEEDDSSPRDDDPFKGVFDPPRASIRNEEGSNRSRSS